jgi:outer membrane lipoprotein-sorting protein
MKLKNNGSIIVSVFLVTLFLFALGVSGFSANDLSGNEILKKVDKKSEMVTQGEMLSIINFDNLNADGTESSYKFGALARKKSGEPNFTLIYYLEPKFVRGSIFLTRDKKEGGTDMWLFLSALGQVKKLSTSKQEGSFANSTLSYEEIGSRTMSDDYNAKIAAETKVQVDGQSVPAYKLSLTAKEEADPQYPEQTVWIGKDNWVLLRSENFNSEGQLKKKMELKELTTFEGNTVTKKLATTAVDTGASTTVTYVKRERPEKDIPGSVFQADNLKNFDPAKWGLTE